MIFIISVRNFTLCIKAKHGRHVDESLTIVIIVLARYLRSLNVKVLVILTVRHKYRSKEPVYHKLCLDLQSSHKLWNLNGSFQESNLPLDDKEIFHVFEFVFFLKNHVQNVAWRKITFHSKPKNIQSNPTA